LLAIHCQVVAFNEQCLANRDDGWSECVSIFNNIVESVLCVVFFSALGPVSTALLSCGKREADNWPFTASQWLIVHHAFFRIRKTL